ncbi:hypothetical protein [Streptomyces roseicoloratus]|uniref:DUF3558 domain-containing protein n=1 Tax=Streptomyces roseicoloratus TaxID=2508722 RepID=A0ABY9RUC4_9ACTN|nr:hypothetical protein [Streptomyces roseicoloratus]WMX45283.1 hypothetical protein RGF97_11060 [Streptomyces roseicoloratus]
MISEPELVGGGGFPDPAGPPLPQPPPAAGQDPAGPAGPRARHPWLWALGGAVAASAVWAGGLSAYDRYGQDAGPDLGGYRTDRDPCEVARFDGLVSAFGAKGPAVTEPRKVDRPALFDWDCTVTLASKPVGYTVDVSYRLHRKTDPGPEFADIMEDPQLGGGGEAVGGVGESAYFGGLYGDNSLRVLDGQAELGLALQPTDDWDEETNLPRELPQLDPAAIRTYLVEDMRQLMAALKN